MSMEMVIDKKNVLHFCSDFFFYLSMGPGVESSPLLQHLFIDLLHQPWMMEDDDCGLISGMNEL
jgi:hypothetical protein